MASNIYADERNDIAYSHPMVEETTVSKHMNSYTAIREPPLPPLPFDLVVEILSWLPVKSLVQFQCICKSWKSLISDSKFAKKQLQAAMSSTRHHHLILTFINQPYKFSLMDFPLSSVFAEGITSVKRLEYPLKDQICFDHMVGSCHGILYFRLDQCLLLWNPSIKKFIKLPPVEKEDYSSYYFSFGYDNFSDSYKVVAVSCYDSCLINHIRAYRTKVKVYTLGVKSWKKIEDFPFVSILLNKIGKFLGRTINWLVSTYSSQVIVSLDFEKESYREIILPDFGGVIVVALKLEMLKDCLCIFCHNDNFSDVWLMKEYGNKESWTKLFRVPYTEKSGSYPLYVYDNDQVLLDIDRKLVVYDSTKDTFKDIDVQNIPSWMDSEVYVESLISPAF